MELRAEGPDVVVELQKNDFTWVPSSRRRLGEPAAKLKATASRKIMLNIIPVFMTLQLRVEFRMIFSWEFYAAVLQLILQTDVKQIMGVISGYLLHVKI